jgi:hypothetical protein
MWRSRGQLNFASGIYYGLEWGFLRQEHTCAYFVTLSQPLESINEGMLWLSLWCRTVKCIDHVAKVVCSQWWSYNERNKFETCCDNATIPPGQAPPPQIPKGTIKKRDWLQSFFRKVPYRNTQFGPSQNGTMGFRPQFALKREKSRTIRVFLIGTDRDCPSRLFVSHYNLNKATTLNNGSQQDEDAGKGVYKDRRWGSCGDGIHSAKSPLKTRIE